MIIKDEEIEKQNFLNWYCFYAKPKEIERAMRTHRAQMERYINKYYSEIIRIRKINNLRNKLL
ncbi:MAG: hypothetical protein E3K37_17195 [Candidatus Kuenenia sp.]|nr:hypothetical protein [Candidatus Kuenenia hertensis]